MSNNYNNRFKRRKGDDDDDNGKRFSKAAGGSEGDASDTIVACEISKNRKVVVRKWKGQVFVDIREFWNKDGESLPSKKGISLSLEQWTVLQDHAEEVDAVLASMP
ncbi:hypothetical protein O6H91_14G047100 [Diphasiastrum complanatum]|uniref:Uncharacterized protein n=1 Tax=Diphasiastrum complanatum TaxID=34168 RepID=A0ACC2BPS9_DIPCM|nr:hypothetical protein O6H91_14G047100 [Diphasiastrum complanatum]